MWGTVVGAVGGSVFVWANRSDLPSPWPDLTMVAWTAALVAYLYWVFVRPRPFRPVADLPRRAGTVYLLSVVGMLLLIRVGSAVLGHLDHAELRPPVIVAAVGAHFLPFARAFRTPVFWTLGWVMVAIGAVGVVGGWFGGTSTAAAVTVVAGIVMLAVITRDAATGGGTAHQDG
ncbi:hypothetical protein EDD33_1711 [Nocardioides aurantiacus]|uniref:Uncharacterized protein n=1 Tax=Nocardioides aurantiacus TaxID=86796 RepID=A0A3N2CTJ9_9ACTN|nr:hypothetical protein EDD33_1711 [Nocardioides aurantiacus]